MTVFAGLLLAAALSSAAAASPLSKRDAFTDCLSSSGVRALTPADPAYGDSVKPFNQRFEWLPAAVALPQNTQDVAAAVKCAAQYNIATVARSGSHSYTAYSLGGQDGSLVVDLAAFKNVTVNGEVAKIGAGTRLGDVALGLFGQGQRAMPHGTCPTVGTGGHVLAGGFGLDSRSFGLSLDRVIGHEIVLANGTIVQTSADATPDLFWALRGAGWSYGIVTSFTVQTVAAPASNVIFTYNYDLDTSGQTSAAGQALYDFQTFGLNSAPAALGIEVNMGKGSQRGRVSFQLSGMYLGSQANMQAAMQPLLTKLPAPTNPKVQPLGWLDALVALSGSTTLNTTGVAISRDTFYAASLQTPQSQPLSLAAMQAYVSYLGTTGFDSNTAWFTQTELYGGANSAIAAVPTDATSFANRDTLFTWQLYASSQNYAPPYPSDGIPFVQGMRSALLNAMGSSFPVKAYYNYDDSELASSGADSWKAQYFGSDHYNRLLGIKRSVDPNNVFRFPQSIGTGDGSSGSSSASASASSNVVSASTSASAGSPSSSTTTSAASPRLTVSVLAIFAATIALFALYH